MSNATTKTNAAAERTSEMPPLDLERVRVRGRGTNAHRHLVLPLSGIRKAAGKTQEQVAEAAELAQGAVSRLEAQDDFLLSTLERYAAALGANVAITFTFPTGQQIKLARK